MKTTLEQQRKACVTAQRVVLGEKTKVALNDAASTLSALNLIGQDVVLIAPELIQRVSELLAYHDDMMKGGEEGNYINKIEVLRKLLKRLPE